MRTILAITIGPVLLLTALLTWPLPEMPREGISEDFLILDHYCPVKKVKKQA